MNLIKRVCELSWRAPLLIAVAALTPGAVRAQAGYVHDAAGNVRVHSAAGEAVGVKAGDTFEQGTTFETSGEGRAVIKFEDGQLAALEPNTTVRIEQYRFDLQNARASSSRVILVSGASRFVTGLIGSTNRQALRLFAGSFEVYLRGTDVTMLADVTNRPSQTVAVNLGTAWLASDSGSTYVGTGQFATMLTRQLPSPPAPITVAPAVVQATANSLAATALPDNLPVVVASSARAAAASAEAKQAAALADSNPNDPALRAAAEAAQSAAEAAAKTATNQSAVVFREAILAGYKPPAPPAFTDLAQRVPPPLPLGPTPLSLGCTGSPC